TGRSLRLTSWLIPPTPSGEAMANMLTTFSQFERRLISQRTKEALAVKKANGVRLGRPPTMPQAVVLRIQRQRARGDTVATVAAGLNRVRLRRRAVLGGTRPLCVTFCFDPRSRQRSVPCLGANWCPGPTPPPPSAGVRRGLSAGDRGRRRREGAGAS